MTVENKNQYLAKTLRKLRLNAGYTQQNIADALNINRSTYTYYETGKTTPDVHTLKELSKMFKVGVHVFLEDEESSVLADPNGKRPKKRVHDKPEKIGELSSKEKSLIALLRTSDDEELDILIKKLKAK